MGHIRETNAPEVSFFAFKGMSNSLLNLADPAKIFYKILALLVIFFFLVFPISSFAAGYPIYLNAGNNSPADDGQVWWGAAYSFAPETGAVTTNRNIVVPEDGTITFSNVSIDVNGTLGSAGTVNHNLFKNDVVVATSGNLGNSAATARWQSVSSTTLSIPVVKGDKLKILTTWPAWSTNPTQVALTGVLWVTTAESEVATSTATTTSQTSDVLALSTAFLLFLFGFIFPVVYFRRPHQL